MRSKRTIGIALGAAVLTSAPAASAEDASVFQLYDHFTIAQVVGESCSAPTAEQSGAFSAQFEALGEIVEAETAAANPALEPGAFDAFAAKRRHQLQASVKQFLAAEGCGHADAIALAAKYVEFQTLALP